MVAAPNDPILNSYLRTEAFLQLASALTGVSADKIRRANQRASYLSHFQELAGKDQQGTPLADIFIKVFMTLTERHDPETAIALISSGDLDNLPSDQLQFSSIAQSLCFFLLTGQWQDLADPKSTPVIPTSAAYTEGLVWLMAQTHPVGYSRMAAGSWKEPPPKLSDFIGT